MRLDLIWKLGLVGAAATLALLPGTLFGQASTSLTV